tara:strand:- start:522 stop:1151 length:630 start_codon:yes stop_codon:yes gene_type:complete
MISINEWFVFSSAIDDETCNKLKRHASKKWEVSEVNIRSDITEEERISGRKYEEDVDNKNRISDIAWSSEQWVYDLIWPYMIRANEDAGWKYDITSAESTQITRYKKGGFYNFHTDGSCCHLSKYNNPENAFFHDKVRKLSMIILLNDSFEGGQFEFASYSKEDCTITPIEMKRGYVVVFPSHMEHRVAPVTKGTRYSLVCWFLGPPFK